MVVDIGVAAESGTRGDGDGDGGTTVGVAGWKPIKGGR